ncbi:MAG TPA: hypothetical protein VHA73_06415 [Acidimicrobiales bacterium]|jgi:hypothetical protein|nr:hypothetical protein [Acidimicrobiales bacterium]
MTNYGNGYIAVNPPSWTRQRAAYTFYVQNPVPHALLRKPTRPANRYTHAFFPNPPKKRSWIVGAASWANRDLIQPIHHGVVQPAWHAAPSISETLNRVRSAIGACEIAGTSGGIAGVYVAPFTGPEAPEVGAGIGCAGGLIYGWEFG